MLPAAPHPCAESNTAAFCPPREWEGNKTYIKGRWEGNKTYIKGRWEGNKPGAAHHPSAESDTATFCPPRMGRK